MPLPLSPRAAFSVRPILSRLRPRHFFLGAPHSRPFSPVTAPPQREQITVPCRSNGSITVDVFHAPAPSSPIVIYLPPGPVLPTSSDDQERIISILRHTTAATLVRINYRASSLHHHPTPLHDLLFGYDWIRDNLLHDDFQRPFLAPIAVCGELIGASLATSLALTECRLGQSRITAAAVNNPIVDWVFPEDLPTVHPSKLSEPLAADETAFPASEDIGDLPSIKPRRKREESSHKISPVTAWQRYGDNPTLPTLTLLAERDILFHRPEDCFDRFASPIHFFRSPHAQMLLPLQDDMLASTSPDELLDAETQFNLHHYASVDPKTTPRPELPMLTSLPNWNITTGKTSPLHDQAKELTKVLRRSVARHSLKAHAGRTRWHDASEKAMYEENAEQRILFNTLDGFSLWSEQIDSEDGGQNVQNLGTWMKQHLELSKI
ncbi:Alpha/Beta hydrolase protein [Phaeosphaeriaceae sp. PMI808]|nr:Alpha/Beta hydrolase protein [Phaeosphaeriaceae sp. PMI808]